jgi:hypothetical protein
VLGIEPDEELVARARADLLPELAGRVRFEAASVLELAEPGGRYDVALLSWSL